MNWANLFAALAQADFPTEGKMIHIPDVGELFGYGARAPAVTDTGLIFWLRTDDPTVYKNTGTMASPTWMEVAGLGAQTFTGLITASGGVAGNVTGDLTGNVTGNVSGATGLFTTAVLAAKDGTSGNITMTSADFGKVCMVNNGTNARDVTLPAVGAGDIGKWITIYKSAGATGALTVTPEATGTVAGGATHAAIDALYDTATYMVSAAKTWIIIASNIA